jgi:hypothetical protein
MHAPRPDTVERVRLKRDDLILLCSDGLWGPLTQRQLLHALVTRDVKQAIPELADLAEVRAGQQCDNVSVLAMAWGEDEVIPTDEPPTIPAEQLPTDVHDFTATDLDFMHMSDEDIEKAIADIKAALRKASQTQR